MRQSVVSNGANLPVLGGELVRHAQRKGIDTRSFKSSFRHPKSPFYDNYAICECIVSERQVKFMLYVERRKVQ